MYSSTYVSFGHLFSLGYNISLNTQMIYHIKYPFGALIKYQTTSRATQVTGLAGRNIPL